LFHQRPLPLHPAAIMPQFSALGFAASTPFIGAGRNNFSHGVKILFQTLCPPSQQKCFEANQALSQSGSECVLIQASHCPKAAHQPPSGHFARLPGSQP
jgi:hypothetical protein